MGVLDILRLQWNFLDLTAPTFAWVAAGALLVIPLLCLLWLFFRRFIPKWYKCHKATKRLDVLRNKYPSKPSEGLPVAAYDAVNQLFEKTFVVRSLLPPWQKFCSQFLIRRTNNPGNEGFWASASAEEAFSEAAVIESRLNIRFWNAIPGITTGLGLFVTFLAILVALLDVRLVNNRVQGLDLLIHGLSGKFVSSVAALLSATLFLILEKPISHKLNKSRKKLVAAIDNLFPKLTTTQALADIHRDIAEQSIAFRHFNSDLSLKLTQSFNESMGPTLERMVTAIEDLNQMLRAAEAQKQESMVGQLEALLRDIEKSIVTSLEKMGDSFTNSLSGSAMNQFKKVADTLGSTSDLLINMNGQFLMTQNALNDLISLAKSSTSEQMALGKTQVEELTHVLRNLMTQLQEAAGSSVSEMSATLTAVTHNLSEKVSGLGIQMAEIVKQTAGEATGAAQEVIQKANTWSSQSAEQLDRLIEKYQSQLELVADLEHALKTSLSGFKEAIEKYGEITTALGKITNEVNITVSRMSQASETMKSNQESLQSVVGLTSGQIECLNKANAEQKGVWG